MTRFLDCPFLFLNRSSKLAALNPGLASRNVMPSTAVLGIEISDELIRLLITTYNKITPTSLENERYRVRLDANGDVASVFDKALSKELLSAPARLAFLYQKPTRHPAWNMDWEDQKKPPVGFVDGPAKVSIVENGSARVALKIERKARGSKFSSIVRLSAGGERVEFLHTIDWRTAEASLKALFPLTATNPKATYDTGIGTVERGNNWEKLYEGPSQRWFDLTDKDGGFGASVLSEAKYGSDKPDDQTLRLTLLYTPGVRDNYQHQASNDWGRHEIKYALSGHAGDWRKGETPAKAAELVQPLMVFTVPRHGGALGRSVSFARIGARNVTVMAMKKAEDSDETIVRLLEREGKATPNLRVDFARPVLSVREVDGQEHRLPGPVRLEKGGIEVDMKPFGPRAFAVRFASVKAPKAYTPLALPFNTDATKDFDGTGRSISGELLPSKIQSGGIEFRLEGGKAVRASGQKLAVPKGRRLYLLAASAEGDRPSTFGVDGRTTSLKIQAWDGFVGQWDNRLWEGATEDEKTFGWSHKLLGIAPGFIKRDPIAWYADHLRLADGSNDAYHFCYLYRYSIDLPAGAKTLTLPNDPRVVILAATVTDGTENDATPLHPLYDTLQDHPRWQAPL
ncbi:hypothetical protein EON81_09110 [bacterium]|nr:MAG: hypothetical protein EON81_09110 [bacterium]